MKDINWVVGYLEGRIDNLTQHMPSDIVMRMGVKAIIKELQEMLELVQAGD